MKLTYLCADYSRQNLPKPEKVKFYEKEYPDTCNNIGFVLYSLQ